MRRTEANGTIEPTEERPPPEPRLSRASVQRFSLYLRYLEDLLQRKQLKVSSSELGEALAVTDAQVRKDLAVLGSLGQPGIGYATNDLIEALRHRLGIDRIWLAALVGMGNLGNALLRYRGFEQRGFRIVALLDSDPDKIGATREGLRIHSIEDVRTVIAKTGAELALIAVPTEVAQKVADGLIAGGIRGLLNFAPVMLRAPETVSVLTVDLTVQLEQLAFLVEGSGRD